MSEVKANAEEINENENKIKKIRNLIIFRQDRIKVLNANINQNNIDYKNAQSTFYQLQKTLSKEYKELHHCKDQLNKNRDILTELLREQKNLKNKLHVILSYIYF